MHSAPSLAVTYYIGPAIAALVFVLAMSLVREPRRRSFNAILVAGAGGAYLSGGGFGVWEALYAAISFRLPSRACSRTHSSALHGSCTRVGTSRTIYGVIRSGHSCRPLRSAARSLTPSSRCGFWPARLLWSHSDQIATEAAERLTARLLISGPLVRPLLDPRN
jgi:hypothetical protein